MRELRRRLLQDAALIYDFDSSSRSHEDDESDFWRSGTTVLVATVIAISIMLLGVINFTAA